MVIKCNSSPFFIILVLLCKTKDVRAWKYIALSYMEILLSADFLLWRLPSHLKCTLSFLFHQHKVSLCSPGCLWPYGPPILAFQSAGVTDVYKHTRLNVFPQISAPLPYLTPRLGWLVLNSQRSTCLCLPCAEIKGGHHHAWPHVNF